MFLYFYSLFVLIFFTLCYFKVQYTHIQREHEYRDLKGAERQIENFEMENEKISMKVLAEALDYAVAPATKERILKAVISLREKEELKDRLKKQEGNKAENKVS